jgi:toxin ParE1/3/4
MTRLELAPELAEDIERITFARLAHEAAGVAERHDGSVAALAILAILAMHPLIGRPAARGRREPVIGRDTRGYVARHRHDAVQDTVVVIASRAK